MQILISKKTHIRLTTTFLYRLIPMIVHRKIFQIARFSFFKFLIIVLLLLFLISPLTLNAVSYCHLKQMLLLNLVALESYRQVRLVHITTTMCHMRACLETAPTVFDLN